MCISCVHACARAYMYVCVCLGVRARVVAVVGCLQMHKLYKIARAKDALRI